MGGGWVNKTWRSNYTSTRDMIIGILRSGEQGYHGAPLCYKRKGRKGKERKGKAIIINTT
jgi:hypothetical protein